MGVRCGGRIVGESNSYGSINEQVTALSARSVSTSWRWPQGTYQRRDAIVPAVRHHAKRGGQGQARARAGVERASSCSLLLRLINTSLSAPSRSRPPK
jgi:hypothetical protein